MWFGVWTVVGAYKSRVDFLNIPSVIQRNTCKIHILNVNLGFFDTRLKMNKNEIKNNICFYCFTGSLGSES